MKIIYSILVLFFCSSISYCQETEESKKASEQYQDFVEDMFDDDEDEDEDNSNSSNEGQFEMPSDEELKALGQAMDSIGSLGKIVTGAATTYRLVEKGCSQTYICMWNTLAKYAEVLTYEKKLQGDKLDCKERQILIEDYILFIGTINLDPYCIEHLHPDNNELEDHEIVDAMLAMGLGGSMFNVTGNEITLLNAYYETHPKANPFCTEDLLNGKDWNDIGITVDDMGCSCGEYIGLMDQSEKAKVLEDIRSIIDEINPIWQGQKLIQLNKELNMLPCNN